MNIRHTIIASTALLALAACGSGKKADDANANVAGFDAANVSAPATAAPAVSAAQTFANTAAASDAFEIATSQLALTNGSAASVKSFARKMIDAHTASTAKLKTAAAGATPAVTPDPTLTPDQQQKVDQLKALNGKAFDEAYITEQTAGHQQTLDALKAYAATGDTPTLKAFAAGLVPTVTAHLNMAKGLKA